MAITYSFYKDIQERLDSVLMSNEDFDINEGETYSNKVTITYKYEQKCFFTFQIRNDLIINRCPGEISLEERIEVSSKDKLLREMFG